MKRPRDAPRRVGELGQIKLNPSEEAKDFCEVSGQRLDVKGLGDGGSHLVKGNGLCITRWSKWPLVAAKVKQPKPTGGLLTVDPAAMGV